MQGDAQDGGMHAAGLGLHGAAAAAHPFAGEALVMVAAGTSHFCALTETGVVWVWGSNDFGQLGTRGDTDVNAPNHWYIKSCGTPFVMVACVGRRFACCRTAGSMRAAKRGRVRTGMPTATTGTGSGECAVSRISSWGRPGWGTRRSVTKADQLPELQIWP